MPNANLIKPPAEPWQFERGCAITQGSSLSVPVFTAVDVVVTQSVILAQRLVGNGPLATGRYRR